MYRILQFTDEEKKKVNQGRAARGFGTITCDVHDVLAMRYCVHHSNTCVC